MKKLMLEQEMENYLLQNKYDIKDTEDTIDSTRVIDEAVSLGYHPYLIDGTGPLHDTYLFVKKDTDDEK